MDHKLTTRRDLVNKMGPGGFKNTIALILGGLSCAAYFLFVVVSIPVYIFRLVVKLLAKWFRPDLGEILNGTSSMFVNDLFTNKPPRTTVVVTMYVRGCISLDEMKDLAMKGWIRPVNKITGKLEFVQFQQYPVRWLGFTFYKNAFDTFHINNHVILHTPRNGKFVEENELNEHVEKILNDQFTPKQSPWELHVIPVYKNEKMFPASNPLESSVLLFKVHHSLADGFSIVSAIVEGFCGHPLTNMKLPIPRLPQRTPWEKIQYITGLPLSSFCEMSYVLSNSFRGSPWKVADDKKEWYQFCGKSDIIPVTSIKQIKNKFNVSFTSVLLSAISAGIFNSLMDVKRKTGYENREHASPQSMYCLSALPIPGRTKRLTNRMTAAFFDIPCAKFENPVERLVSCDQMLESTKRTVVPYLVKYYLSSVGCHFYPVCQLFKNRMVSTGLTNFPSVPIHIRKNGKKAVVVDFASGSHEGEAGVGIMVLSYHEHIRVVVTAEKAVMSKDEVNNFIQYITDEIAILLDLAAQQVAK